MIFRLLQNSNSSIQVVEFTQKNNNIKMDRPKQTARKSIGTHNMGKIAKQPKLVVGSAIEMGEI